MAEKKSKLAVIKTKPTTVSAEDFINGIADEQKRNDSFTLLELIKKETGEEPVVWSNSIIGFGMKRYKSPSSGREVDWFKIGFSPRKTNMSIYLIGDVKTHSEALARLGKHKIGLGCLYVNKLQDVDMKVLEEIIVTTIKTGWQFD